MADKALLVGINEYKSISHLQGCLNDVVNLRNLLIEDFGFDENNVKTLEEGNATLHNIEDGFEWLLSGAQPGDRIVFHFSGHGSFIDSDDDDEPVDELLCLYDMDWDDLDTYLIDDDLGRMLEDLPDGVHMTVILDACHSGTGTKAISSQGRALRSTTSKSRLVIMDDAPDDNALSAKARSAKAGQQVVSKGAEPRIARFVTPPAAVQKNIDKARHRFGGGIRSEALNHQLLAGADATETAADAFIDDQYQGAFTHYLCKSARDLEDGIAVRSLFDELKSDMAAAGYHQTPQLEGRGKTGKLFGGEATAVVTDSLSAPEAVRPVFSKLDSAGEASPDKLAVLSKIADVQASFLQLGHRILELDAPRKGDVGGEIVSRGMERIVYVHGISQHRRGYSDAWYNAMRPHLRTQLPKSEVLWSDLVNPRNFSRSANESKAASDLKAAIEKELKARSSAIASSSNASGQRALPRGSGFSIDDFVRYMTIDTTRNQIIQRFDAVVRPLLASGETIHIVSHSWGTVVAYEGLRSMDALSLSGRVKNLFTVGSALSITAVQWESFQPRSRWTDASTRGSDH